jgi:hypothetical protein
VRRWRVYRICCGVSIISSSSVVGPTNFNKRIGLVIYCNLKYHTVLVVHALLHYYMYQNFTFARATVVHYCTYNNKKYRFFHSCFFKGVCTVPSVHTHYRSISSFTAERNSQRFRLFLLLPLDAPLFTAPEMAANLRTF